MKNEGMGWHRESRRHSEAAIKGHKKFGYPYETMSFGDPKITSFTQTKNVAVPKQEVSKIIEFLYFHYPTLYRKEMLFWGYDGQPYLEFPTKKDAKRAETILKKEKFIY